jgi:thiol-disulfide isomerase/thioredoxin
VNDAPRRPRLPGALRAPLVAAVLLASAAVGYLAHRLTAPQRSLTALPAAAGAPAASAAPSAREEPPPPERKVPETLPGIALPGIDGRLHRLTDWKGKPLLINFWATWCEPCRREIPLLRALRREHATEHLEVIGIAIDSPDAVHKYATERGIDYPLLIGEEGGLAAATAFGMDTVLPFSVFADSSGRIVTLKVGELHRDEAELILDDVRQLDSGALTPDAARARISAGLDLLPRAPRAVP